jgi:hypothetical protein
MDTPQVLIIVRQLNLVLGTDDFGSQAFWNFSRDHPQETIEQKIGLMELLMH